MGTYNNTTAQLQCPRCGRITDFVVELYFGNTANMVAVPIGTPYPFCIGRAPHNGGPLTDENPRGMGYAVCPNCGKDFHCVARIENGVLTSIAPDRFELPFIPDRELVGEIKCPDCDSTRTRLQLFNRFDLAKLICDACCSIALFRKDGHDHVVAIPVIAEYALVRNK